MKVRLRFAKLGKVRWTSHRDIARIWERALRRAGVPVAYSQGFSPRPRLSFGLALPTGAESLAEYLDVELDGDVDPAALPARLSAALPLGVDVTAAAIPEAGAASLQHDVTSCSWRLVTAAPVDPAPVLEADRLVVSRERKGRVTQEDIRPGILALVTDGDALIAELATQPRAVRPAELLDALGADPLGADTRRIHQWITRDGHRWEPLPVAVAPHASERAS